MYKCSFKICFYAHDFKCTKVDKNYLQKYKKENGDKNV